MDILIPKSFFKSHRNVVKQLIFGNQIKYLMSKQSYYFDKSNTILYPAKFEMKLIYNISKNINIILESIFIFDNKYYFMLDNNYELLANSKNFEDEYYLNKKIFQVYNIKIMDILKYNLEKLNKYFENEFNKIEYQKYLRQIKTEEYFISQFYSILGDGNKNNLVNNEIQMKGSKNNIILKLIYSNVKEDNLEEILNEEKEEDDDEKKIFLKENKKSLSELFDNPREILFNKIYNKIINKGNFIENIAKELTKIPDNDLILENDKASQKLITSAKKLIAKFLNKNELSNNFIKTSIKFCFFYDKPFYFIKIDDEKKLYLKISKNIHFENIQINKQNLIELSGVSSIKSKNSIPYNKNDKKSRNIKQNSLKSKYSKKIIDNQKGKYNNKNNNDTNEIIKKINGIAKKINRDRFILIIRWLLSTIIIVILILSIIIIFYQKFIIRISKQILFTYYHNIYTKDAMLFIHSRILLIYYDYSNLTENINITEEENKQTLIQLSDLFKSNHYVFWDDYFYYNSDIGNYDNINLIYKIRNFKKIENYWDEINYDFDFSSEIDVVIYKILSVDVNDRNSQEFINDLNNFLFFKLDGKKKIIFFFCKIIILFLC